MRFHVDVAELAVVLELDTEPAGVDLTRDGLGDRCLDAAVEGIAAVKPPAEADGLAGGKGKAKPKARGSRRPAARTRGR